MQNVFFDKFFLISFLLLITTLFIVKVFNLLFTIPIILIGTIFILVSNIEKFTIKKYLKLLFINSGLFFIFTGIIFSISNIIYFLKNSSNISYIYEGGYFNSSNYIKSPKEPLGYRYKKNKTYKTSLSFLKRDLSKEYIYDVKYTIDERNNRYAPSFLGNIDKKNSILFLGCSFTFGEGLNDFETLSYYLQESTRRFSINAGLHGYGSHQALHILENDSLFERKTEGSKVKVVLYRAMDGHISRMKRADAWGPCYKLNDKDELTFRGNLNTCDDNKNQFLRSLKHYNGIREPFTKYLVRKTFFNTKKYTKKNYSPEFNLEFKTYIKSIIRMRDLAELRGARFIVLNEDLSYDSLCIKSKIGQAISDNLKKNNIEVYNTSEIFTETDCNTKSLFMSDNHPTAYNNYVISNYLSKLIKPVSGQD